MTTTPRSSQRTRRARALLTLAATGSAVVAGASLAAAADGADPATPPVCATVSGDELGRDDGAARIPLDGTGLVLVRDRSLLTVEGRDPEPVSLTTIDADGTRRPGWAGDDGLRAEVHLPDYAGVEVCWGAPTEIVTTEPTEVTTGTDTTVPDVVTTEPTEVTTGTDTTVPDVATTVPDRSDTTPTGAVTTAPTTAPASEATTPAPADATAAAPPGPRSVAKNPELARTGASPAAGVALAAVLVIAGGGALAARRYLRPAGSR